MTNVIWVLADGRRINADVSPYPNLMEAAVANGVDGVIGECGGCLSCATCHVYVDESWATRLGKAQGSEDAMLDATSAVRRDTSRLSCQIPMSEALDGLILHVPG